MSEFPKPAAPDYKTLWKSYAGWIQNINTRTKGAFSDVRARLSAAGASPDLIKMQTEHLESQRVKELEGLKTTETFRLLQEGLGIAAGTADNPYATEGGLKTLFTMTSPPPPPPPPPPPLAKPVLNVRDEDGVVIQRNFRNEEGEIDYRAYNQALQAYEDQELQAYEDQGINPVNPFVPTRIPAAEVPSFEAYFTEVFGGPDAPTGAKPSAPAARGIVQGGPGGSAAPNPWLSDDSNVRLL